jgi:hypothetical protein
VVPAPVAGSDDLLLVLYLPTTSTVDLGGGFTIGCGQLGDSYHSGAMYGTARYAYAIVLGCPFGGLTPLAVAEDVASHEIIEAMTDPYPFAPAYLLTSPDEPWSVLGGEVADLCAGLSTTENGYTVQRVWSSSQVARGDVPCIPVPAAPPYRAVSSETTVAPISAGQTMQLVLQAWSSAPAPPWHITVVDATGTLAGTQPQLDRASVGNGDAASVKVTAPATAASGQYEVYQVLSSETMNPYAGQFTSWAVAVYVP